MGFDRFDDKIGKTEYYNKKKYFGEKVPKMENVNLTRKVVNLDFFPQFLRQIVNFLFDYFFITFYGMKKVTKNWRVFLLTIFL